VPNAEAKTARYPKNERIAGYLEDALAGEGWIVVEEGLGGRTAGVDAAYYNMKGIDPADQNFNGERTLLPILWSCMPLDSVVIFLGLNDARNYLHQDIDDVTASINRLINLIKQGFKQRPPYEIILVSPPLTKKGASDAFNSIMGDEAYAMIKKYPEVYRNIANQQGVKLVDAAQALKNAGISADGSSDGVDGLHLSAKANKVVAQAIADALRDDNENIFTR
jgi:lysophospholipase L1-like esterase